MNKQAKDFSGHDIGRGHILMTVCDYSKSRYNIETKQYDGLVTSRVWCEINMITHKKNGNVRLRTAKGEREFAAEDVVELLD